MNQLLEDRDIGPLKILLPTELFSDPVQKGVRLSDGA